MEKIAKLCALGLFLAGYVFYSSSLIESYYAAEFHLTSWEIGFAQSAVPFGAILGAMVAGRLSDLFGRQRLLTLNFLCIVLFGLFSACAFNFPSLCFARMANGFLAGTLYPLCAAYLTEMTPETSLARQSALLMFINCLAAPTGCVIAFVLSTFCNDMMLWRLLSACHGFPALYGYLHARRLPESNLLLVAKQKSAPVAWHEMFDGIKALFNPNYKHLTLCLMGAWFLMDVAYYGINFFVPYLLQIIEVKSITANFNQTHSLLSSETMWGTLIINIFFMLGALAAVFVVEKVNLIKLQKKGFLFASISLFMLAAYFYLGMNQAYLVIVLFILFNFALNLGPDVTTYMLSATSYPVEMRGSGHGFVAGFAKCGSFLGVLFLPRIQDIWGYQTVIMLLAILLFTAYVLTISLARHISGTGFFVNVGTLAMEDNV